jgi:hypothetical protein
MGLAFFFCSSALMRSRSAAASAFIMEKIFIKRMTQEKQPFVRNITEMQTGWDRDVPPLSKRQKTQQTRLGHSAFSGSPINLSPSCFVSKVVQRESVATVKTTALRRVEVRGWKNAFIYVDWCFTILTACFCSSSVGMDKSPTLPSSSAQTGQDTNMADAAVITERSKKARLPEVASKVLSVLLTVILDALNPSAFC